MCAVSSKYTNKLGAYDWLLNYCLSSSMRVRHSSINPSTYMSTPIVSFHQNRTHTAGQKYTILCFQRRLSVG